MPFAVTHVLSSLIAVDLYRDYITKHKKYFTLLIVLIAGIAGLLPDIDVPLNWLFQLLGISIDLLRHRGLTHTPLFGLIFLIPAFYFWLKKKHKTAIIFFVITFGIFMHLFLDVLFGTESGSMLLWPFSSMVFKANLLPTDGASTIYASVDAVILIAWLIHEEVKHKIKDFF